MGAFNLIPRPSSRPAPGESTVVMVKVHPKAFRILQLWGVPDLSVARVVVTPP
jgi:hypothetical protein